MSLKPAPTKQPEAPNDIRAIMADIRKRTKDSVDSLPPLEPTPESTSTEEHKSGELIYSKELKYLNEHHSFPMEAQVSDRTLSTRSVIKKPIKKFITTLRRLVLKEYLHLEQQFSANLVRYLNHISTYIDGRNLHLVRKIDSDIRRTNERLERIHDEHCASIRTAERNTFDALNHAVNDLNVYITKLQASSAEHGSKIDTLDSVTKGLERISTQVSARLSNPQTPSETQSKTSSYVSAASNSTDLAEAAIDYSYLLLENRFRGSEEEISKRLSIYPPIFKDLQKPILEIGSGRGELQTLFKSNNVQSYGVELDGAMVERCKEQDLNVSLENGLEHLATLPNSTLSGVIAIQVIEHLTQKQLKTLLELCKEKIEKGGKIVFETINSDSMIALTRHYFRDPTHVWPLHPDTMSFLMEIAGFKVTEVRRISPFPAQAQFQKIPIEDYMTPKWVQTVSLLNQNFQLLNNLLFGHQDYCIIAEVE